MKAFHFSMTNFHCSGPFIAPWLRPVSHLLPTAEQAAYTVDHGQYP
jgi:hypothetical protein